MFNALPKSLTEEQEEQKVLFLPLNLINLGKERKIQLGWKYWKEHCRAKRVFFGSITTVFVNMINYKIGGA